ncbi:hypothetical protein BASA62_006694 [Batrachochytrium salamandrivorans]|nr:hypothetical protein BASA62_006694 [Batrachochytrium salamandrivorans]
MPNAISTAAFQVSPARSVDETMATTTAATQPTATGPAVAAETSVNATINGQDAAHIAVASASLAEILDGKMDDTVAMGSSNTNGQHNGNYTGHDSVGSVARLFDSADIMDSTDMAVDSVSSVLVPAGNCIECEDQPAVVHCLQCADDFCQVCFSYQHRKGSRKAHPIKRLYPASPSASTQKQHPNPNPSQTSSSVDTEIPSMSSNPLSAKDYLDAESLALESQSISTAQSALPKTFYIDRAKFIPLRLEVGERKFLRLLEAALNVSEYTDKIDVVVYSNKTKRVISQIKELCAVLSGLVVAADYKVGQDLFQDRDFQSNAEFFMDIFELGRRHKIMNPEKMRGTYGKLVYMLQDSQIPEVKEMLEFTCVKPIKTVYNVLDTQNGLAVLQDPLMHTATMEIVSEGKPRSQIQHEIQKKEKAIEILARKYGGHGLEPELIRQCLYSIGDNHAFLRTNRDPCDKMLEYLQKMFNPKTFDTGYSLAIQSGRGGARLSHGHEKQYQYVLQSLTLWREVLHEMFMLWTLAEQDLLDDSNYYRLRDTGQGLNRVQAAPRVSRIMHTILHRAQQRAGNWVGSSVIHLGDHNVPNALMFIDKYTQIYRILLPIVSTLSKLPEITSDPDIKTYIDSAFGSVHNVTKEILCDFFRHAFRWIWQR